MLDAVGQVQVADEGAHQPRLADAGGQREAERRELALEVRDGRELAPDISSAFAASPLLQRDDLATRARISSESRCGGRRLRRLPMALT